MSKYYKSKTIYEPIYDFYLRLIVSNDHVKLSKKHDVDLYDDYATTSKTPKKIKGISKRCYTIIYCADTKVIHEIIDIIAHEADHAAGYVMEDIGANHDWADEPKAYLTGWIAKELSKLILTK